MFEEFTDEEMITAMGSLTSSPDSSFAYSTIDTIDTGVLPPGLTIGNISSNYMVSNVSSASTQSSPLHVTGNSTFDGDLIIKGRNLMEAIEGIEKRLAILVPNPNKLAQFEALRKAYEQYKMLEALCDLSEKKDGQQ